MLKGIPGVLSPELLKILCEMGQGDEIVLADSNFPCMSIGAQVTRCDGLGAVALLNAILTVFPLDASVKKPVTLMEVSADDSVAPIIWDEYRKTLLAYDPREGVLSCLERDKFLEKARSAYAIIATGEKAAYANMILRKGVVF